MKSKSKMLRRLGNLGVAGGGAQLRGAEREKPGKPSAVATERGSP